MALPTWCLSRGAPALQHEPRGATLPSLRGTGLHAGPFPYNEGRRPGGPSRSRGCPELPTNLEAPRPPGSPASLYPATSIGLTTGPGAVRAQRQGPSQPALGVRTQYRRQQESGRSRLQNQAGPEFPAAVPAGEASRCAAGRHEVGPEHRRRAGPGPGVRWPGGDGAAPAAGGAGSLLAGLWFYLVQRWGSRCAGQQARRDTPLRRGASGPGGAACLRAGRGRAEPAPRPPVPRRGHGFPHEPSGDLGSSGKAPAPPPPGLRAGTRRPSVQAVAPGAPQRAQATAVTLSRVPSDCSYTVIYHAP